VPVATEDPTLNVAVEVPLPGIATDVGLKLTVTPFGAPLADKVTASSISDSKRTLMVEVPASFCATLTAFGDADMEKSGG
jgi:hypothetical protein